MLGIDDYKKLYRTFDDDNERHLEQSLWNNGMYDKDPEEIHAIAADFLAEILSHCGSKEEFAKYMTESGLEYMFPYVPGYYETFIATYAKDGGTLHDESVNVIATDKETAAEAFRKNFPEKEDNFTIFDAVEWEEEVGKYFKAPEAYVMQEEAKKPSLDAQMEFLVRGKATEDVFKNGLPKEMKLNNACITYYTKDRKKDTLNVEFSDVYVREKTKTLDRDVSLFLRAKTSLQMSKSDIERIISIYPFTLTDKEGNTIFDKTEIHNVCVSFDGGPKGGCLIHPDISGKDLPEPPESWFYARGWDPAIGDVGTYDSYDPDLDREAADRIPRDFEGFDDPISERDAEEELPFG